MWVKICANTNLQDAMLAVDAGADAVGFVFAASPRQVNVIQVSNITKDLPNTVEKIGVFVDADFEKIVQSVEQSGLTGVQLHAGNDELLPGRLREYFGSTFRILRVVHYAEDLEAQLRAMPKDDVADGVLIDSRTATAVGGTGVRFDWQAARGSFVDTVSQLRLIAAGGLNPENVAEAICTLRPWGVDVASGVESAPGKKDPERVRAFVQVAKSASYKDDGVS
jgi:phosphoribosylanthranilate isomerase